MSKKLGMTELELIVWLMTFAGMGFVVYRCGDCRSQGGQLLGNLKCAPAVGEKLP